MEHSCEILFELKYLEEISELFNELKEINNHLLINLLDRKNYCDFYDFIRKNTLIREFNDEENDLSDIDEENNL